MSILSLLAFCAVLGRGSQDPAPYEVGLARVDVTPSEPIRLSGYAARSSPTSVVEARLHARALALEGPEGEPALVLAVDAIGIPWELRAELGRRLEEQAGIDPARLVVLATHSHTAPELTGVIENLFGHPLPEEESAAVARYTRFLVDRLAEAALAALAAREPARITFARGSAGFAANRRTAGGPVDRAVPLLALERPDGELLGLLASYACHCTTLGPDTNAVCGDWAGFAADEFEAAHPGATALIGIGCGADANPGNRLGLDQARAHGHELAGEIERLLAGPRRRIEGALEARLEEIELDWDALPARAEWEARATRPDAIGGNARLQLARLERGEDLAQPLAYRIGVWHFGDDLALAFLAGEVVVDYSIRLARELDGERSWVFGYANDLCCYIPSRRVLAEGGYEAEGAMTYYARPGRLAPALEDSIVATVVAALPASYRSQGEEPRPLTPEEAVGRFVLADPELAIDLVACEPALLDPVAVAFDLAGRAWVAEMRDYPEGMDGALQPGGTIRCLEDLDHDGFFESSTVFLRDLPFPTGVAVWRDGLLVAAAPDLLFARDRDGDRVADEVRVLFTGFPTHNEQARVNSLQLGFDGWWYAASGLFGGEIRRADGSVVCDTSGRDFRFRPETLELEPVAGLSQHGRIHDDLGEWLGCDAGTPAWHFPLREEVLARNPHVLPPAPRVALATDPDATRLFPVTSFLERFNEPESIGHLTSGCGNAIYRDRALGEEYAGDLFVCDPAYNLVTRLELERAGTSFRAHRAPRERDREFLASSDPWFRPVQAVTAPDGSLWILDMYRRVIEHPRWLPPERLARLDVRGGEDRGRIWRLARRGSTGALPELEGRGPQELLAAFDGPNGSLRDTILEHWIARGERSIGPGLAALVQRGSSEAVRVQALAALDLLGLLTSASVRVASSAGSPAVQRQALRILDRRAAAGEPELLEGAAALVRALAATADPSLRMEVAQALAHDPDPAAGAALARILLADSDDEYVRAACLASAPRHLTALCAAALDDASTPRATLRALAATLVGERDGAAYELWLQRLELAQGAGAWGLVRHAVLLEALRGSPAELEPAWLERLNQRSRAPELLRRAYDVLGDPEAQLEDRLDALGIVAGGGEEAAREALLDSIVSDAPIELARRALAELRPSDAATLERLLERALAVGPSLRAEIVASLAAREPSLQATLRRAAEDSALARAFDLSQRQRLREHGSAEVRELARAAFGEHPSSARSECIARILASLDDAGDPALGKEVFAEHCSKCHLLDGLGRAVGPDLAAVTDRSDEGFLQSILDPNRAVLDAFVEHVVETVEGETLSGIVSEETATGLVLTGSDGLPRRLLRSSIEAIRPTRTSLMPEGFELLLSPADFSNLLAYLRPPRQSGRPASGSVLARVEAASDGSLLLEARAAELYGQSLVYEEPHQNLGYWHEALDRAEWTLLVPRTGEYLVEAEWACAEETAGNPWVLEIAGRRLEGIVASTGGWDRYERKPLGSLRLEAGERRLVLRPARAPRWALMDLHALRLVPH